MLLVLMIFTAGVCSQCHACHICWTSLMFIIINQVLNSFNGQPMNDCPDQSY